MKRYIILAIFATLMFGGLAIVGYYTLQTFNISRWIILGGWMFCMIMIVIYYSEDKKIDKYTFKPNNHLNKTDIN